MKSKPVLFLDFDDLKFSTLDAHVRYINKTYGIITDPGDYANNPPLDTIINKYLPEARHVTDKVAYRDLTENFHPSIEWHENVMPVDGMPEALALLSQKYELWTVTARPKQALPVLKHLLEKHAPHCIAGIHCVWDYLGNGVFEEVARKADFIRNFQGDKVAFIDDSPKEILRTQEILPSYLFDMTGRHDSLGDIKLRVKNWKEVTGLFL